MVARPRAPTGRVAARPRVPLPRQDVILGLLVFGYVPRDTGAEAAAAEGASAARSQARAAETPFQDAWKDYKEPVETPHFLRELER